MIKNARPFKRSKNCHYGLYCKWPWRNGDADYGYVGSGPGWISLYRGKEVIERGIASEKLLIN
jgi:(E)-4-hydroxy-3-methylbut-2-enyl-diphosphate synthase